jgi:hypothetical protein
MKGYEIFKGIANKEIKDGTQFRMLKDDNIYTYRNNNFVCKYGGMNVIKILNQEFEIIEDKEDINIQDIEELTYKGEKIRYGSTKQFTDDVDDYCPAINSILDSVGIKINEIIRAVKHLEKTKEDK